MAQMLQLQDVHLPKGQQKNCDSRNAYFQQDLWKGPARTSLRINQAMAEPAKKNGNKNPGQAKIFLSTSIANKNAYD